MSKYIFALYGRRSDLITYMPVYLQMPGRLSTDEKGVSKPEEQSRDLFRGAIMNISLPFFLFGFFFFFCLFGEILICFSPIFRWYIAFPLWVRVCFMVMMVQIMNREPML